VRSVPTGKVTCTVEGQTPLVSDLSISAYHSKAIDARPPSGHRVHLTGRDRRLRTLLVKLPWLCSNCRNRLCNAVVSGSHFLPERALIDVGWRTPPQERKV
jgi:hypothetical protein